MSRLAALKEYTFMRALRESGFRVPEPLACNRHTIVMELIEAFPLRQIKEVPDPAKLYAELIEMTLELAQFGLIHGDFNEFNILIKEDQTTTDNSDKALPGDLDNERESMIATNRLIPYLIDFPQMVSVDHANAQMYFDRDVDCIKAFFERRFHFTSDEPGPHFTEAKKRAQMKSSRRLDVEAEASGYSKKMAKELEKYMQEIGADGDGEGDSIDNQDGGISDTGGDDSLRSSPSDERQRIYTIGSSTAVQEPPHIQLKNV